MILSTEIWDEYVKTNKDPYGKCCVEVAEKVIELLDKDDTPLRSGHYPDIHTPHGLICKANNLIGAGGISGFMAGAVAEMVSQCHSRGEEFRKIWNRDNGIPDAKSKKGGVANPALITVKTK